MKEHFSHHCQNVIELFSEFRELWKIENNEWIAQRKTEWEAQNSDRDDIEARYKANFYIYGDEPPTYVFDDSSQISTSLSLAERFAYTPFRSQTDVSKMWRLVVNDSKFNHRDTGKLLRVWIYICKLPYNRERVDWVLKEAFNVNSFNIKSERPRNPKTIKPLDFVVSYWSEVSFFFSVELERDYSFLPHTFDYLKMSILEVQENGKDKAKARCREVLLDMFRAILSISDTTLSRERIEIKRKLIAIAKSEESPVILRESFLEANR